MKWCILFVTISLILISAFVNVNSEQVFSRNHLKLQKIVATLPSLQLHVTLKHKAMELHGISDFQVYANPLVSKQQGDRVLYNGYTTFTDGPVRFTYSLVDGAPYLMTINSSSDAQICINRWQNYRVKIGNLFKTSFAGVQYAVCFAGKAGFTAYTSAMTITVNYLDNPVAIPRTTLKDGSSCNAIANAIEMTPTALALLSGTEVPVSTSRILKEETHMAMASSSCSCKSTPRPCLLFHGLGNEVEERGVQDTSRHFGWEKIESCSMLHNDQVCCTQYRRLSLDRLASSGNGV
ncbi:unnamed protein product [Peronospora effusa]|nr:unnamed protein product [Peronospora effusa]